MLRRSAALVLLCLSAFAALATSGANATRTPVPDIVSVETHPFSAIVKWRVPDAGRVVLEVGVDDRYGIWSPTTAANAALTSRTTRAGLEPATTYRFRVLARWRNGMKGGRARFVPHRPGGRAPRLRPRCPRRTPEHPEAAAHRSSSHRPCRSTSHPRPGRNPPAGCRPARRQSRARHRSASTATRSSRAWSGASA